MNRMHAMDNPNHRAGKVGLPGTAVAKPLDSGLRRNDEGSSPRRRPGSSTAVANPLDSGLRRNDETTPPGFRPADAIAGGAR